MKRVFVYGATSAIAQKVQRIYAGKGNELFLVARSSDKLESVASDLRSRGKSPIHTFVSDALDFPSHQQAIEAAYADMGGVDIFLIAHGTLPDQEAMKNDAETTVHEFAINATSVINLSTLIATRLEEQGKGTLAVISSVAGERGRKALYTYSAAKSAVTEFLSGLRQRFSGNDKIKIITLKPGIIESPMTAHLPKSPLMADSGKAGQLIYDAIEKGKEVAYVPGFWKPIMGVIKTIPEGIFKKLEF